MEIRIFICNWSLRFDGSAPQLENVENRSKLFWYIAFQRPDGWVWQESIIRSESVIRLPRSSRSHSLHQNTFHIMRRYNNDYQELSKSLSLPLWLWWYNHKTINMNIEGKLFAPIFYLSKHSGLEKTKSSLTFVFPLDKRADKRSPLFNPFLTKCSSKLR